MELQPQPHGARLNQLLAALPGPDFDAVAQDLEPVALSLGDVIYEPGARLPYAVFPTTSIVSLHYVTATGASSESAAVGRDGVVGLAIFMGGDTTASSARVLVAGDAYRLPAGHLQRAFQGVGSLRTLLLRYAQSLITQIAQVAACTRHHPIDQQFCRWLLCTLDRAPTGELLMTQNLVSRTLGVRRESVTEAAVRLQQAGVIRYRRGRISVLDRAGLERRACECYGALQREQAWLMSASPDSWR